MARPKFNGTEFLDAAMAIAAAQGPAMVTVGAITERLKAPTGSFYHRFVSRDVLLGELWLRTVLEFREGIRVALDAGDALRACLHTPVWGAGQFGQGATADALSSRRFRSGRMAGGAARGSGRASGAEQ